jgi:hypothetical protein
MTTDVNNFIRADSLFIMFMIIFGGNCADFVPCNINRMIKNSVISKHFIAFNILLFSVFTPGDESNVTFFDALNRSIIIYLWFLMITKVNRYFFCTIMVLVMVIFLLSKVKSDSVITMNVLLSITFLTTIIGFGKFFLKKLRQYGDGFSYFNFIFGAECSQEKKVIGVPN